MGAISYDDHYGGAYKPFVRQRRVTGTTPLLMFEIFQPAGDFSDPPVQELVLIELKSGVRGRWSFGAGRHLAAEAGLIAAVPPNQATEVVVDHPHMLRAFALPDIEARLKLEDCFAGVLPDFTLLQFPGTRDPLIASLLHRLWLSGADENPLGQLFADTAILTLIVELARVSDQPKKTPKGGLSPYQLRRACEFIEASIEQDIGLSDLAHVAGLSPFHFARAFKHSTGLSPVQYLTKRRVAHAQFLLTTTDMPLAEVAFACGFANQSSFTAAFGRETGLSPGRWRRASR